MGTLLQFPIKAEKAPLGKLDSIRDAYIRSGLSLSQANAAVSELEPLFARLFNSFDSNLVLSHAMGLTEEQVKQVTVAHTLCIQQLFTQVNAQLNLASILIAGVVGSKYAG